MFKQAHIEDVGAFNIAKEYLSSLGITFNTALKSYSFPVTILQEIWDEIKSYLSEDSIADIQEKYDFSMDCKEFRAKYYRECVAVRWSKPLDDIDLTVFDDLGKHETVEMEGFGSFAGVFHLSDSKTGINMDYCIELEILYNGNHVGKTTHFGLQEFMKKMDRYTLFLASDFWGISDFLK